MPEPLDPRLVITVPEHAAFERRPAGPLPRALAYLLDMLIRVSVLLVLWYLLIVLALLFGSRQLSGMGSIGFMLLILFILEWGYHVVFEAGARGQTPGKRALGIQVVDRDGRPPGWSGSLLRNLLRAADFLPFGYVVGVLTCAGDRSFRRLGDMAAGTLVVYTQQDEGLLATKNQINPASRDLAPRLPARLLRLVTPEVEKSLALFLSQRRLFVPARRREMAAPLAEALTGKLGLASPTDADVFLCALALRLRAQGHGRSPALAGEWLEQRRDEWDLFAELLDDPRRLTAPEQWQRADLHRAVCADLALAQGYGLRSEEQHYLRDLVATGHGQLHHGETRETLAQMGRGLWTLPGRIRRDPCAWLGVGLFYLAFALSAGAGWLLSSWPAAAVGPEVLEQLEGMYADAHDGRGVDTASGMTAFYIRNNVGIALSSFAAGIFFGIGSLVILLWNALAIGAMFGHMLALDTAARDHFLEFVTAHGPFELTGIGLCAGAGLRMGWGAFMSRGLGLLTALRQGAGQALPVLLGGALLVALAAPIEGFISPSALSYDVKFGVGLVCTLFILVMASGLSRALGWERVDG